MYFLNLVDINRLEICLFVVDMLEVFKYANYEAFLYLLEYQYVIRLSFRRLNRMATKPQVLGVESLGLTR